VKIIGLVLFYANSVITLYSALSCRCSI